jgi:hypothetical protein
MLTEPQQTSQREVRSQSRVAPPLRLIPLSEMQSSYYRARYYDPSAGRFLSEDPLGFNGEDANFFSYVANSSASFVDPWGLQQKSSVLGPNPFPAISGGDLATFSKALRDAEKVACDKNCDGALQAYGIKSLAALVNQMVANINVFDGRNSTYPAGKQSVSQFLAQGAAGAMVLMPVPITFLGDYFFNPTSIEFMSQQRALMLLHESVHQFGGKGDPDFGGSKKLSQKIAEKCFPALNALSLLGHLTN